MFSAQKNAAPASGRLYVEDVFSTWLYTGNASSQTITNGIDLAGKGGMVWFKSRNNSASTWHQLVDTIRGKDKYLFSNATDGELTETINMSSFNSNGFSLLSGNRLNSATDNFASWTFRKAPKFFDVVTYTGTGANRTIAHNLGVAPGCILVKRTNTSGDWQVYHRSNANTQYMVLNLTDAVATGTTRWNSTTPTSTEFTVGTDATVNASGGTYVAYLFAHDATSDGLIQCGSFSMPAGGGDANVNLGWEPQWLLLKDIKHSGTEWFLADTMRGYAAQKTAGTLSGSTGGDWQRLFANLSNAESQSSTAGLTSTGFTLASNFNYADGNTDYIYIAIRRGPMKTPTLGTSVFAPVARTVGTGSVTTNFPVDTITTTYRDAAVTGFRWTDRLRGGGYYLGSSNMNAEVNSSNTSLFTSNTGYSPQGSPNGWFYSGGSNDRLAEYAFRRAPGFFDEVCYTGTGVATTFNHNLGVAPELMIVKGRSLAGSYWAVYASSLGASKALYLNMPDAPYTANEWNSTAPTATVYSTSGNGNVNGGGYTYVAYLFASCPGVSKVGSYTGNGSSQTINCGFAAGSRFVMIKRTDSTGDWYVWDTARGIVAGNDPHLSLNTTAAEVTTDDTIDTDSSGFVVNQVSATNVNVSSATYIYLAIA